MLWRIAGKPEPDPAGEGYDDVAAGSEHEKAALWAKQVGIFDGEEGKLKANAAVTQGFLGEICRNFLGETTYGDFLPEDAAVTRAQLAETGMAVWKAYEAQETPVSFGTAGAGSP